MKKIVVPVEVYSRVVGYFRPVAQWNPGKREEFSERTPLKFQSQYIFEKSAVSQNKQAIKRQVD